MMKMYKKAVAIMLTLVFVLSLVPVVGMAETTDGTETIKFTNYAYSRTANETRAYGNTSGSATNMIATAESGWYGYAQLDLSGYEEVLKNPNTEIKLSLYTGTNGSSSHKVNTFRIYMAKDSADVYKDSSVTYKIADSLGLHTTDNRPVLYERATGNTISRNKIIYSDASVPALVTALDEGTDNSIVTLYFAGISGTSYFNLGSTNSFLEINYDSSQIDNKVYVNSAAESLTWDKISVESDGNVTSASKLPLKYKGAVISWQSSNPDVINPDTGVITQPKGEDAEVELEATLKYTSFENIEKTAAEKVKMNVTVTAEEPVTLSIPFSAHTYIRSGSYADRTLGVYSVNGSYSRFIENTGINKSGDKAVFLKYDFSNCLNILDVANAISININVDEKNTTPNGNLLFSVLPDSCESWAIDNLTYNTAVSSGLYTTPAVYTEIVAPVKDGEISSSAQMLDAIKNSIGDNPDDGVVCFKWSGIPGNGNTSYRVEDNKAKDFTITLSYYASDLKTNEELAESKLDSMPWSFVSQQAQDKVISNLTLPESFYGVPIEWASSDEKVITSSGEVKVGAKENKVTLTAKLGENTKDFVVTVPADVNYILDYSKSDYVNAYVWAKETGSECTLVIATYEGNELVGVKAIENFVPQKGKNFKWTDLSGKGDGKTVKIMLLENMTTLKPLAK